VAGDLVEGLAPASIDGKSFGFIDKTGKWTIQPTFHDVDHFSENFAIIYFSTGSGVSRQYSSHHRCKYTDLASNPGGLVEATRKSYIDKAGRTAINRQFDEARRFKDGIAAVQINGKWGYLAAKSTGPR
jgi:hypothetical protein